MGVYMSVQGDNTSVELSILGLLEAILMQLKAQTMILKEISGIEFLEDDIDG